jgi:tripartite-type tricarboxylate transporter receptor subunit TctC
MIDRRSLTAGLAVFSAAAAFFPASGAYAQDADFSGQTIEWVVPLAEGGGTDVWARFLAPYLSKYLPGQPKVIIRNVPGGGSITGTNEFAARAKADGSTLIGTTGSTALPMLLGDLKVKYDFNRDFVPVIVSPSGGVTYLPPSAGVTTPAELKKLQGQELVYGSQGPTSLDLVPMLGYRLLGLKVRHVFGMTGRADGRLAFERGEATIDYQTTSAYLTNVVPLVEAKKAVPIFSWGVLDSAGNIVRDPTFPDLPSFVEAYEAVHGKKPEGIEFEAYKALFGAALNANKPAMLPIKTPPNIVAAYRKAFEQAVKDPDLLAKADDILGKYDQAVGSEVEGLFKVATTISPEAREWVRNFLTKEYQVKF